MKNGSRACCECEFWESPNGDAGICRRYPPYIMFDQRGLQRIGFPVSDPESWCGEFLIRRVPG